MRRSFFAVAALLGLFGIAEAQIRVPPQPTFPRQPVFPRINPGGIAGNPGAYPGNPGAYPANPGGIQGGYPGNPGGYPANPGGYQGGGSPAFPAGGAGGYPGNPITGGIPANPAAPGAYPGTPGTYPGTPVGGPGGYPVTPGGAAMPPYPTSPAAPSTVVPPGMGALGGTPSGATPGSMSGPQFAIEKQCSGCKRTVPLTSHAGGRCPHCGAVWDYETGLNGEIKSQTMAHRLGIGGGAIGLIVAVLVGLFREFRR